MKKFLLDDPDFEVVKRGNYELLKTDEDEYTLLDHWNGRVWETNSFSKEELRILWEMLNDNQK